MFRIKKYVSEASFLVLNARKKFNNLLNYEYAILKYVVCVLIYDDHKLNKLIFQGEEHEFCKKKN